MSNKVRGEKSLTIGKVEYLFRPEHDALARVEGRLDVGLLDLAARFLKNKPRHTDVAVILQETSRAGGRELPYKQAWDFALLDIQTAAATCAALLLSRFGPEEEAVEGKAQATTGN